MAKDLADLTQFPDTNIRATVGHAMCSMLHHFIAVPTLHIESRMCAVSSDTALSLSTAKNKELLTLCGTAFRDSDASFALSLGPCYAQWLTHILTPTRRLCCVDGRNRRFQSRKAHSMR